MTQEQINTGKRKPNEKALIGIIIIGVGVLILLRNLDFYIPHFLFTWPMILILIGLVSGVKHKFRNNTWWILLALGGFFLIMKMYPELNLRIYFWPVILFAVGFGFLLSRGGFIVSRKISLAADDTKQDSGTASASEFTGTTGEDIIDAAAVFGVVKKNMYSKNFKGGEVVTVFGGTEINLMHADFSGQVKLEIVNIFGGTTLYIPAHWQIRSEAVAVFGSIEDKRERPTAVLMDKVLILDGFVMFGGIDIKSA